MGHYIELTFVQTAVSERLHEIKKSNAELEGRVDQLRFGSHGLIVPK